MDADTILSHLGPYGLAGLLMIAGMRWLRDRLAMAEQRAEERAREAQARCDADRRDLSAKVDKLEDRIAVMYDDTVRQSANAIAENVSWLKRLCDSIEKRNDAA